MTISKRRGVTGRKVRRSRITDRTARKDTTRGRAPSASSFPGKGMLPSARRKIARAAGKVSPKLIRGLT